MGHPIPARAIFMLDRTELRPEGTITDQIVAVTGPRGPILDLKMPVPDLKGPIPDIVNPLQGLRGSILDLREPILSMRGFSICLRDPKSYNRVPLRYERNHCRLERGF